jgi:hypothetical protein
MIITRETTPGTTRLNIDLDLDFSNRNDALNYIYDCIFEHKELKNELYNADNPAVWIAFKIKGHLTILSILLT